MATASFTKCDGECVDITATTNRNGQAYEALIKCGSTWLYRQLYGADFCPVVAWSGRGHDGLNFDLSEEFCTNPNKLVLALEAAPLSPLTSEGTPDTDTLHLLALPADAGNLPKIAGLIDAMADKLGENDALVYFMHRSGVLDDGKTKATCNCSGGEVKHIHIVRIKNAQELNLNELLIDFKAKLFKPLFYITDDTDIDSRDWKDANPYLLYQQTNFNNGCEVFSSQGGSLSILQQDLGEYSAGYLLGIRTKQGQSSESFCKLTTFNPMDTVGGALRRMVGNYIHQNDNVGDLSDHHIFSEIMSGENGESLRNVGITAQQDFIDAQRQAMEVRRQAVIDLLK